MRRQVTLPCWKGFAGSLYSIGLVINFALYFFLEGIYLPVWVTARNGYSGAFFIECAQNIRTSFDFKIVRTLVNKNRLCPMKI